MQFLLLLGVASSVVGFPGMGQLDKRALPLSQNEGNSGPIDSTTFSAADQYVNVKPGTTNEFRPPGPNDKRGPCPGLNAAANHGFLPRSGIATIPQSMSCLSPDSLALLRHLLTFLASAVTGLGAAYSFGSEFAAALAAIAIVLTGDPTGGTWSIGGGYTPALLGNLISNPEGIGNSHNTYEADASPGRVRLIHPRLYAMLLTFAMILG